MAERKMENNQFAEPSNMLLANSKYGKEKYLAEFNFPFCQELSKYQIMTKIGHGSYGEVFKAYDKNDKKKLVALKRVLADFEQRGFPINSLREIQILQSLKHENVINMIEICRTKASPSNNFFSNFFMVFEFCEHDLAGMLLNKNVKFSLGEIKMILKQMFEGMSYIHANNILHRDLKTANILITKKGVLKLADFGLSRVHNAPKNNGKNVYTSRVMTLWYRAPELLLGDINYGPAVDIWGAGCIMAELFTRSPIFNSNSEVHHLLLLSKMCGSITPQVWPDVVNLPVFQAIELPKNERRRLHNRLQPFIKDLRGCNLLDHLLALDPSKRPTANGALAHDFFSTDPMPKDLSDMLSKHHQNMFLYLSPKGNPHANARNKVPEIDFHDKFW